MIKMVESEVEKMIRENVTSEKDGAPNVNQIHEKRKTFPQTQPLDNLELLTLTLVDFLSPLDTSNRKVFDRRKMGFDLRTSRVQNFS